MGEVKMHIPFWKKSLSYFREFLIETLESEYNGTLEVILSQGRLQLCTSDAIYSFDDKYDNFGLGFKEIDWPRFAPEKGLILGLGLASIPYILEKILHINMDYTAIEIDDAVIELASRYTLPRLESPLDIYQADGYSYVMQCQEKYDLICLDIFVSDKIPNKFQSQSFFESLKHITTEHGIVMSNRLANTKEDKILSDQNFDVFKSVYPNARKVSVEGNYIFFSDTHYLRS